MLSEIVDAVKSDLGRLGKLGYVNPYTSQYSGPYRYGTKNWWQWYATVYLPQYYNQQQILSVLQRSPYYNTYGNPFPYNYNQGYPGSYYPYGGQQPGYQYNYPYYGYANQYYDPTAVAQYTDYQGQIGAQACAQQGGMWDYFQGVCNAITGSQPYGNTTTGYAATPPNVQGMAKWAAVAALNAAGYNVWLLNEDGVSGGAPPGYDPRRVDIAVTSGAVSGTQIG